MSKSQIQCITSSAIKAWQDSESAESYAVWLAVQVKRGFYWGAKESL